MPAFPAVLTPWRADKFTFLAICAELLPIRRYLINWTLVEKVKSFRTWPWGL